MEMRQDIKTRVCLLDMGQRVAVDLNLWIFHVEWLVKCYVTL